jgi:uncharacterized membrane protein required for colicin V production
MSAIIDIVALALIVISTIIGIKKGFAKTFVSTFGSILSIIFALLLCGAAAKFLESQFGLTSSIAKGIEGTLSRVFGAELMDTTIAEANDTNLSQLGLSSLIIKLVLQTGENATLPPDTTLNKIVAPTFAYYITAIICVIVLFILFKIALFLIAEFVFKARKWKLVKGLDGTLGLILGVIRGIIIVQIIVMIIGILPFDFFNKITELIPKTYIANALSKINVFPIIINAIADASHIVGMIVGAP